MTITVKRSGGFAGIERVLAHVDSSTLTSEQDARARSYITRLSGALANSSVSEGADRFQYEVTVTGDDGGTKSMTVIDKGDPQDPALKIVMELIGSISG